VSDPGFVLNDALRAEAKKRSAEVVTREQVEAEQAAHSEVSRPLYNLNLSLWVPRKVAERVKADPDAFREFVQGEVDAAWRKFMGDL
jgi:hypothetical protein